jgi:hypothetical protein
MTPGTQRRIAPSAKRSRASGQREIDALGLGILLLAVVGFVAVLVVFRPAPAVMLAEVLPTAISVDTHHPVDTHDDPVQSASRPQVDLHHPADRHDEP